MEYSDYTHLMAKRVRSILLVCNNYDNFLLEEDGRLDVQIAQEYSDLNLSNPPTITRAETQAEALEMVHSGKRFDIVMTMNNAEVSKAFAFAAEMKRIVPETPFVLLSSYSKEVFQRIEREDRSNIDYFFHWNNSADLIIAIIKLIEDKLNADHDIMEEGVRAILLVEDSVRYYSTYLPLLYKLVLQQNSVAIRDAINEKQQISRKRSRPKVLMATYYDEAKELYERYKQNIIGVISDIGFVVHKGDLSSQEQLDAGLTLTKLIRHDNPTMPILLQSSQASMRSVAKQLGVGFVIKQSKTLTQELSDYIGREFGFGDFVATDSRTGREIGRADNLEDFERVLSTIPAKAFRRLSDNNYLSKWLFARGLFSVGKQVAPLVIQSDDDIENVRAANLRFIHEYRLQQALGVVAKFDTKTFNDTIWFSRLGSSSLGGKARGLAFLNHILQKHNLYNQWENVRVLVPRTMVITTDYFDKFIHDNGLQYVINSSASDEEILSEFSSSGLPHELVDALKKFLEVVDKPLAIRSSSKLEDSYYQPFAGVYSTYMIPNVPNKHQQLRLLAKAIKSVYASVYFSASKGYILSTGNMIAEEKMAIVLQEVCGSEQNGYFFPTLSGVARSVNFYPINYEKAEDGIAKVAYGLGKVVVDGEQVLRFSPKYPKQTIQLSSPDSTMRDTQKTMLALSMQPEKFIMSVDDAVNLERLTVADCEQFESLKQVASTYDRDNMRIVDSCFPNGPRYITFAPQLKYNTFPLADILSTLLNIAQQEIKSPIEIEYAADLTQSPAVFNVLQIRPISADSLGGTVDWNQVVEDEQPILRSTCALGVGKMEDISDVIYLNPDTFDILHTREMAQTLREWNNTMRSQGRNFLLIGFGRWGSTIDTLGVPVMWGDISEAKVIVECSLPSFRVEPSQGSHFFQNMTAFNVGYINVDENIRPNDLLDFQQLDKQQIINQTTYLKHVRLSQPLDIYIDGFHNKALIQINH